MDRGRIFVRKLPAGVVVSVAVHAAVVAIVHVIEPAPRPVPELPLVAVELVPVELTPPPPTAVERAALPEPAAAPAQESSQPPVAPPPAAPPRAAAAISTGAREAVEVTPPGTDPGATPAPRSPWFDLRRGRGPAVDLRIPPGLFDGLANVPRGTDAARPVTPTGQLQESGGGRHRSDQGPFVATVAPDGGVTLKDRRNLGVRVVLPTPRDIANGISRWYYSDKGPDGQRGERALEKAVGGSIDPGDRTRTTIIPVLGGGFDLTDAIMRHKGSDPYASKKLAFLDSTRDERVQIGTAHREQQLRKTAQIVQQHLDRTWRDVADPRARRQALFELWDEVVEAGDASLVEAGVAARKLVIGCIRARLPAGGPDAYTAEELAALNRRRQSKALFQPYAD
jgi:hypothetical protein